MTTQAKPVPARKFSDTERQAIYDVIFNRRDVRDEFLPKPIPAEVLDRILAAAHRAPSVGLSQPWNFIVIDDPAKKQAMHDAFLAANDEAQNMFADERQDLYASLKLQGVLKSPINICVTCDRSRGGKVVLGRTHQPEMDLNSALCAVQNLWLAARAENIGVGWLSIVKPSAIRGIYGIPDHIEIIAYLCVGYIDKMYEKPELAMKGWTQEDSLESVLMRNGWQNS